MNEIACRIRRMEERDIPQIMTIERASFPVPWTVGMFQNQLADEDISINLVLVEEERVVAYATAWIVSDEVHLLSIAVDPARRRRGHAEKLLAVLIEEGRGLGAARAVLEVRVSNVAAQRFYAKHHFHVIGARKRYYRETGEDALVMERIFYG